MRKIAFISTNEVMSWGGSEELWSRTAVKMASQGFVVNINVPEWKPNPTQIKKIEESNCSVTRRLNSQSRLGKLVSKAWNYRVFDNWLDRLQPGLIVISQGNNIEGLRWIELCLKKNIPYVIISHAASENLWPDDDTIERLAKVYREAKKCFFVSQSNLDLTDKQFAFELNNAKVIRNPFNVSYDVSLPWPDESILKLAYVARLHPPSKGQDILFEVLRAEKWRKRPIKITLFGNGPNEKSLLKLKNIWNLENVEFGGYINDVESIWANHHGLILTSRYEGLPLAVVEAMLCGRFCIVTDIAGNTELLEENFNGFIAKAPKAEFVDDALEKAWQARESWREMGHNAAVSIRNVIPRDPIEEFANELKLLLDDMENK